MSQPVPVPAARPQWWRVGRSSIRFILDTVAITRGEGDAVDPLILTAVLEANAAPINQDLELSRAYATLDQAPPDSIRRPVSVNAVAASLGLPYETVRRRVARLAAEGRCAITPRGVIVPQAVLSGAAYTNAAMARYERLRTFYFELKALDALGELPPPDAKASPYAGPPVRIANRAISEYMLRMIDGMMRRLGDPLSGLVLIEMARANAERLSSAEIAFEGPMPDSARHPVKMIELARRLHLPPETVRRHVRQLEAEGYCRKVSGGRLAVLAQLARDGPHGLAVNLQNVHRLMARLAAQGVIAHWEAEADRPD